MSGAPLPNGIVAIVKRDCPTCELVVPVLAQLAESAVGLTVFTQDDPSFPPGIEAVDDTGLDVSYTHDIETVPTLLKVSDGAEVGRLEGWSRPDWEAFTGVSGLGVELPEWRPGCGSLSVDPDRVDALRVRFEGGVLRSRRLQLAALEDEMEALFERGWSDGLPLVPPTEARVLRMLEGTTRAPDEVVAVVPPILVETTVEKIAVNAVMAGCRPEYLPVVLAAVEAACTDTFNIHGLLCTTYFSGPVLVVNGPIARRIGMNAGHNVLGQGNRANLTIGRALQLVIRNVGGGRPGRDGIDRSAFGSPSKLSFCFAEDEANSPWKPLSVEAGFDPDVDTVTLFAGHGPSAVVDQLSRSPEDLVKTFATRIAGSFDPFFARRLDNMMFVVGPEHARVFHGGGWDKMRVRQEINSAVFAASSRGVPDAAWNSPAIVFAGGDAGMFSAMIEGWVSGPMGSQMICHEIRG
ncbi:MAG: thioredoxin family protein [Acidimicrobiia bacterium]|nr:thioredoxin family protein [Acidimicrobiia bacterium]